MCARNSLDAGMQAGEGACLAGHQTSDGFSVGAAVLVMLRPGVGDGRVLSGKLLTQREGQVAALEQFLPILLQCRVAGRLRRVPVLKKTDDGAGNRGIDLL